MIELYTNFSLVFTTLVMGFAILAPLKLAYENGRLPDYLVLVGKGGAVGYLFLDVLVNLTFVTGITLDLPKELTLTSRMKRYKLNGSGTVNHYRLNMWRKYLAKVICGIANIFDPGHC